MVQCFPGYLTLASRLSRPENVPKNWLAVSPVGATSSKAIKDVLNRVCLVGS